MANCIRCGRQLPALTLGKKICQWCVQHEAAQRGELEDDVKQPVMAAPWVRGGESSISLTQILLGANVMVFIAMVIASDFSPGQLMEGFPGQLRVHFGANFGPFTLSGQWWRLFTYMFLHGGLMHFAFNMWCLWDLGALCESLYGRWTFACIYVITGIAAGIASLGWNPGTLSVGASGAIFGLAGALISSFYLGEFSLPSFAIKGTLRSLLFFVGFSVLFGRVMPGIDNAAHGGGLVSGLILGALIARLAPQIDKPGRRVSILALMCLVVLAAGFGVHRWRGSGFRFGSAGDGQGNVERRISELRAQTQKQPNDASLHNALAQAYFRKGQFPEGQSELKRVLEIEPQNTPARLELGTVYLQLEQPAAAADEFSKVIARDPNNATAHAAMGVALAHQNHYEAAIEEYKAAAHLEPKARGLYYRMGMSQVQLKQHDAAIASYLKEKELNGDAADLEGALADAYEAKGMTQQAQDARNKATQLRNEQTD